MITSDGALMNNYVAQIAPLSCSLVEIVCTDLRI